MFIVSTLLLSFTAVQGMTALNPFEVERQKLLPKYNCHPGLGQKTKLLASTRALHRGQCAIKCEAWKGDCVSFDFTEMKYTDWRANSVCRLYSANDPADLNQGNVENRDFCVLVPTVFYQCQDGQGQALPLKPIEESRAGSRPDCARRCGAKPDICVGFDYSEQTFRDKRDDKRCRIYPVNTPRVGPNQGSNPDGRTYCAMRPTTFTGFEFLTIPDSVLKPEITLRRITLSPTAESTPTPMADVEAPEFTCEDGQGEASKALLDTSTSSYDECATKCDNEEHCVAFDYAEALIGTDLDAHVCRLYPENKPRVGDLNVGNSDNRKYCVLGGVEVPEHTCVPGQGEPLKALLDTAAASSTECARKCDSDLRCAGFDYTEMVFHNELDEHACRLYPENTPRVGPLNVGNGHNRMYCAMAEDEIPEYTCHDGQGEAGEALEDMAADSRDECAFYCEHDDDCIAFDFTPMVFNNDVDNHRCRLYGNNTPRVGSLNVGNGHNREYCELFRVTFNCEAGQGEAGKAFSDSRGNSYNECERRCERDARCIGFDYTPLTFNSDLDNHACRLYPANNARSGVAGDNQRRYCVKAEVCGKAGKLRGASTRNNSGLIVIAIVQSDTMTVCQCSQLCQAAGGLEWRFQVVGGQCDCFHGVRKVNTRGRTGANTRERYLVGHFPGSQARIVE